ncbi:MAG: PIN domain-containing protein [Desulfamplus sp.]|nr:PIN domain-containing protein [Desulfamplus sp.]
MADIICFDTQIVIWAVKKEATAGQEEMIKKASYLLEKCQESKTEIIIPSIVVGELLSALPSDKHGAFINALKYFKIPPFDIQAAVIYAKMWQSNKALRKDEKNQGAKREEMKADCMIVATAKARGSSCIYSEDVRLRKFAEGHIKAAALSDVQIVPAQVEFNFSNSSTQP